MTARDFLFVNGHDCAAIGHDWRPDGGRSCSNHEEGKPCSAAYPSQPVFVCGRCGEIDYGERGGPGWQACQDCARAAA